MSDSNTRNQCIELICKQGCTVVREIIVKLEQHHQVDELDHLNDDQKQAVLTELKTVMSVYDQADES